MKRSGRFFAFLSSLVVMLFVFAVPCFAADGLDAGTVGVPVAVGVVAVAAIAGVAVYKGKTKKGQKNTTPASSSEERPAPEPEKVAETATDTVVESTPESTPEPEEAPVEVAEPEKETESPVPAPADETVTEETVAEENVSEETVAEEPVAEETANEETSAEEPAEEPAENAASEEIADEENTPEEKVIEETVAAPVEAPADETSEEKPVEENVSEETVVEESVAEETANEETPAEETPAEAPAVESVEAVEAVTEVPAEPETTAQEATEPEATAPKTAVDPETGCVYTFNEKGIPVPPDGMIIRYKWSFLGRLFQSDAGVKFLYMTLRRNLLSYNKVRSNVSWNFDSYFMGRQPIVKLKVRGKNLVAYFPIDPKKMEGTKYVGEDVSKISRYKAVPFAYRINGTRKMKYAMELIAQLLKGVKSEEPEYIDISQVENAVPYESFDDLYVKGYVKIGGFLAVSRNTAVADDDDDEEPGTPDSAVSLDDDDDTAPLPTSKAPARREEFNFNPKKG